jgi:DNA 3'-phosphatase
MMRPLSLSLALAALLVPGCDPGPDTESEEGFATSCAGAWIDAKGGCRKATGGKLKKSCCAFPEAPVHRRDLGTYACAEGDAKIPVAFFDADSTLRISKSGAVTANTADDVFVLPLVAPLMAELGAQGYLVAVVSNQGGVGAGIVTLEQAEGGLAFAAAQLRKLGAKVDYFDLAEKDDEYRKPNIGMATKLDELVTDKCGRGIDLEASMMIGDSGYKKGVDGPHPDGRPADDFSNSDRLFAENLGVAFEEPTDAFDWRAFEVYNLRYQQELESLLAKMDAEAKRIKKTDPKRSKMLARETKAVRNVNGL